MLEKECEFNLLENFVESKSWKLNRKIFEINQDVSEVKLHRCRQKFPFQSFVSTTLKQATFLRVSASQNIYNFHFRFSSEQLFIVQ